MHPGSPPPHTRSRLHPAPRRCHANPTGSSGAVRTANPMCNSGCVPKAWPTPCSEPSGPELGVPSAAQPVPHPKNRRKERKEGGPRAQRPHGTYGATCGKELGWCHAGLVPSLLQGGSIPRAKPAGCELPDSNPKAVWGVLPTALQPTCPSQEGRNASPTSIRVGLCPVAIL